MFNFQLPSEEILTYNRRKIFFQISFLESVLTSCLLTFYFYIYESKNNLWHVYFTLLAICLAFNCVFKYFFIKFMKKRNWPLKKMILFFFALMFFSLVPLRLAIQILEDDHKTQFSLYNLVPTEIFILYEWNSLLQSDTKDNPNVTKFDYSVFKYFIFLLLFFHMLLLIYLNKVITKILIKKRTMYEVFAEKTMFDLFNPV